MLSLYLHHYLSVGPAAPIGVPHSPVIVYRLDDKPQRRTDCVDVFAHDLLDDCRLACIIQATAWPSVKRSKWVGRGVPQHEDPHLLVLETGFPQN